MGSHKTQISSKNTKPDYLTRKRFLKKTFNEFRSRLGRGTLNTCAKFQALNSLKRRGHWHPKEFWVLCFTRLYVRITIYACRAFADVSSANKSTAARGNISRFCLPRLSTTRWYSHHERDVCEKYVYKHAHTRYTHC